jgi:5'-nucleotidase
VGERLRVLITNDDGIDSMGLRVLARAAHARGHEIFVVAPHTENSGAGAAIGSFHKQGPAATARHPWPEIPDVEVLALEGPPALCAYGACLGAFGAPPDIVLSGINPGHNTGHLLIHSGTVGAAMTAATFGVPGIAVSIGWEAEPFWETAAEIAVDAIPTLLALPAPAAVLNINVPNCAPDDLKGVRDATLATYGPAWVVEAAHIDEHLVMSFMLNHDDPPHPDSDVGLVDAGYAAVTVLRGIAVDPIDGLAAGIEAVARTY